MYTDDAVSAGSEDPILDVFSQRCADDPHSVYHEVHERCPVARAPGMFGGNSVTLSLYDDVLWALGVWSVMLGLSPVIVFYLLMVN